MDLRRSKKQGLLATEGTPGLGQPRIYILSNNLMDLRKSKKDGKVDFQK